MSNYLSEEKDGVLKIKKSYQKLSEENSELVNKLDYITKEELIQAIQILVNRINKLEGNMEGDDDYLEIKFTYDHKKHCIGG